MITIKKSLLTILACVFYFSSFAQDNSSGFVTYEQIFDYDFGNFNSNPAWEAYVADLPKQGKAKFVLSFNGNLAFYEKDMSVESSGGQKLQNALAKGNYGKGPKTETQQVFYNFEKGKQTEQIEFMTRHFLVESELTNPAWKLTTKRKKVLDYVCLGAEMTHGDEVYTAWFSSEIPVSAGPEGYYGLPGLVLAVEKNNEIFMLATQVDLSANPTNLESMLKEGKKMNRKNFDATVVEKTEEYKASMKNKSKGAIKKGE